MRPSNFLNMTEAELQTFLGTKVRWSIKFASATRCSIKFTSTTRWSIKFTSTRRSTAFHIEKIVKLSFGHINKDATRNITHSTTGYILRLNRLLITQDHHRDKVYILYQVWVRFTCYEFDLYLWAIAQKYKFTLII